MTRECHPPSWRPLFYLIGIVLALCIVAAACITLIIFVALKIRSAFT